MLHISQFLTMPSRFTFPSTKSQLSLLGSANLIVPRYLTAMQIEECVYTHRVSNDDFKQVWRTAEQWGNQQDMEQASASDFPVSLKLCISQLDGQEQNKTGSRSSHFRFSGKTNCDFPVICLLVMLMVKWLIRQSKLLQVFILAILMIMAER